MVKAMDYDTDKIDEAVIGVLYLTAHREYGAVRVWKTFDWAAMDRLHEKGLISNPKNKDKSVVLTPEGEAAAEAAFRKLFSKGGKA